MFLSGFLSDASSIKCTTQWKHLNHTLIGPAGARTYDIDLARNYAHVQCHIFKTHFTVGIILLGSLFYAYHFMILQDNITGFSQNQV